MRHFCVIIVLLSSCVHGISLGLQDTIIEIRGVQIEHERYSHIEVGMDIRTLKLDSLWEYQHLSLSQALTSESNIAFKSYGPGGLSNMSIRGGGTAHSIVLWNGLSLQSPMNAGTNTAQLPSFFFEEIIIQQGGSSTFHGSGAVSGVIHLGTSALEKNNQKLQFGQSIGSFGNYITSAAIKTGNEKFVSQIKIMRQQAQNDFPFNNHAKFQSPNENQTNAELTQSNILLENRLNISKRAHLFVGAWLSSYDKNIQTLMTDYGMSSAYQEDDKTILTAHYKYENRKLSYTFRSGLILSDSYYVNPGSDTYSNNDTRSSINEWEAEYKFHKNFDLLAGLNYTYEKAKADGFEGSPSRHRKSIYSGIQSHLFQPKLSQTISFRYEHIPNIQTKPIISFSNLLRLSDEIQVKLSVGSNYRVPSLNDLFWTNTAFASGNPNLVPEYGVHANTGISLRKEIAGLSTQIEHHFYHMKIQDWIIWLPNGAGRWTPQNLNEGLSRGFESRFKLSNKFGNWLAELSGSYQYTQATSTSEDTFNNRQLIYVPKHRGGGKFKLAYKKISFTTIYNAVGIRNYDANNALPAYQTTDFHLNTRFKLKKKSSLDMGLSLSNAFNTNYQVMAWYAMPLNNYLLTINLNL